MSGSRNYFNMPVAEELPKEQFPILSQPLLSCRESVRLCEGFRLEGCGKELEPDQDICGLCAFREEEFYRQRALEEDGITPFVAYEHLTDRE